MLPKQLLLPLTHLYFQLQQTDQLTSKNVVKQSGLPLMRPTLKQTRHLNLFTLMELLKSTLLLDFQ